ncbi:eukaryotic translation elongation factor 2 [Cladochytrium replicatum]|nr:eukaryotic translation elongation factor 2 [Cladochytrium replicatum]
MLTTQEMRELTGNPSNIRNVSVISHRGHGKSTLIASLVEQCGIKMHHSVNRDEAVKLTSRPVSMLHVKPGVDSQSPDERDFLINLVDLGSHFDPVIITDGAIIVVDVMEGFTNQTEILLRKALMERIKPVLFVNKLDLAIFEFSSDDLFARLRGIIEQVNAILRGHRDSALGDLGVSPELGSVAFGSVLQGWAWNVPQFARRHAAEFGMDEKKMATLLWGDNYYDPVAKTWGTSDTGVSGELLERTFNKFIIDPIRRIHDACMNSHNFLALGEHGIRIPMEEQSLEDVQLYVAAMKRFTSLASALSELMILHLPSPVTAQKYRCDLLYDGRRDESHQAISNCDAYSHLMAYVSTFFATSAKRSFVAVARVFSGTISTGQKVRIQGPGYYHGGKSDIFITSIEDVSVVVLNGCLESIDECTAGNIVVISGIAQFLLTSGTITTSEKAKNFYAAKVSSEFLVEVAIDVTKPEDLPKLIQVMKRLSKSCPFVACRVSDAGEHIVGGPDEESLDIAIAELEEYAGVPITRSEPFTHFRETVRAQSSKVCLAKSPNKHNRLFVKAEPLDVEIVNAVESRVLGHAKDQGERSITMLEGLGWHMAAARKVWCFGPEFIGPNMLVDMTKGASHIHEIRDGCVSAFQWATKEGCLADEPMRGVRCNILDAFMFSDAIHRGNGQIIPTLRRAVYASLLTAEPAIMEPVFRTEISFPAADLDFVKNTLKQRDGRVVFGDLGTVCKVTAHLPVQKSFGLSKALRSNVTGTVTFQSVFDHWETMEGSPLESGSTVEDVVKCIRKRKGLHEDIPPLDKFLDKL